MGSTSSRTAGYGSAVPHTWDPDSLSPAAAAGRLLDGNRRFCEGRPALSARVFSPELAERPQRPFAIVLGCSDSRTPVEILFDEGFGDLLNANYGAPLRSHRSCLV